MTTQKTRFAYLLCGFIFVPGITLIGLAALEWGLQSFYSETGSGISEPSICCGYEPKANITEGPYWTDNRGFRQTPYDLRTIPQDKVYKIVFMGGSIVFGKSNSTLLAFPSYFELLINSPEFKPHLPDGKIAIEVVNAAVYGYASQHVLNRLKARVLDLEPDMVIVSVGSNDIQFLRFYLFNYLALKYAPSLYWYLKSSATSSVLKKILAPIIGLIQSSTIKSHSHPIGYNPQVKPPYHLYTDNLRKIGTILKERGIATVFMPWSQIRLSQDNGKLSRENVKKKNDFLDKEYKILAGRMKTVAKEMDIPIVNNPFQTPIITPKKNAHDFLTTRFHLNNFGSKIVAFYLVKAVRSLLEGTSIPSDSNEAFTPNLSLLDSYYKIIRDVEMRIINSKDKGTREVMNWIVNNEKSYADYFILKHEGKNTQRNDMHPTEAYFVIADTAYHMHLSGNDLEAEHYLELALKIAPFHAYPHFISGLYNMEKKNDDLARTNFQKAIELAPFFKAPREYLERLTDRALNY